MLERIFPFWHFGTRLFLALKKQKHRQWLRAGPTYHASFAWFSHDVRVSGSEKTSAFVPGGANGVLLKLNSPSRRVYANNFGFLRDDRSRFMLISACCSSSHQICIGKSLLMVHSPETKSLLEVWMLLLSELTLCSCGSTNCRVELFSFSMNVFITFESM